MKLLLRHRFLLISLLLHLLIYLWYSSKPNSKPEPDPIAIEVIEAPSPEPGSDIPNKGPKRIGNDGEGLDSLPLGDKLAADNYILRIRQLVEPEWRRGVEERIRFRRKARYPIIHCTTTIIITVDNTGFITKKDIVLSCGSDLHFDAIALGVWDRNLPPPPKTLLENNVLELNWRFIIN